MELFTNRVYFRRVKFNNLKIFCADGSLRGGGGETVMPVGREAPFLETNDFFAAFA